MIAAVLKESLPGERRVALIPKDAAALKAKGVDVRVEAGAPAPKRCMPTPTTKPSAQRSRPAASGSLRRRTCC